MDQSQGVDQSQDVSALVNFGWLCRQKEAATHPALLGGLQGDSLGRQAHTASVTLH